MNSDGTHRKRRDSRDHGQVHSGRRRLLKALGATGAVAGFAGTGWAATGGSPRPRQPAATDDGDVSLLENRYMAIALAAARDAAAIHDESFGGTKETETKAPQQLVTEVDRDAEEAIRDTIREELGSDFGEENHALFGEEEGGTQSGDYLWIIDPLDGTTNYVQGIPHFCVSITVLRGGEPYLGLIYYSHTTRYTVRSRARAQSSSPMRATRSPTRCRCR